MNTERQKADGPDPCRYGRRVLLAACGLSPQVVTETVYWLCVRREPAWMPNEIHLITTAEGAERARLSLLSKEGGWFHRMRREYGFPAMRFDGTTIHVLRGGAGEVMNDIRSAGDNERAADAITEIVREMTSDAGSALHVSLAGGRKTMGFYLAYTLSLFGREQDRLSHVLAPAPFESHPDFYYPTKAPRIIYTQPPDSRPLDTSTAEVTLAEIPFVRLRDWLPEPLREGGGTYFGLVSAARQVLEPASLRFLPGKKVAAGGEQIALPPAEMAFYAWFARRRQRGLGPAGCPSDGAPEPEHAREFLAEYSRVTGETGGTGRTWKALAQGMEKAFFLEHKSRLHAHLKRALGGRAGRYLLQTTGRRPDMRYYLGIEADRLSFEFEAENETR